MTTDSSDETVSLKLQLIRPHSYRVSCNAADLHEIRSYYNVYSENLDGKNIIIQFRLNVFWNS